MQNETYDDEDESEKEYTPENVNRGLFDKSLLPNSDDVVEPLAFDDIIDPLAFDDIIDPLVFDDIIDPLNYDY